MLALADEAILDLINEVLSAAPPAPMVLDKAEFAEEGIGEAIDAAAVWTDQIVVHWVTSWTLTPLPPGEMLHLHL
jgi:hypothetical protein